MADKSIGQLVAATQVTPTDLFVLEQSNTAKKLTGQVLENWLVSFADGHGGIQSIEKTDTSSLVDTYTITLADTTTVTFTVTNGKAISSISTYWAVSSSGTTAPTSWSITRRLMTPTNKYLWSYQSILFNDGTRANTTISVVGVYGDTGEKGDTGRGIVSLNETERVANQYTVYTFEMSDGTTESFTSRDGVGITNIAKTSTVGLVDTYTITYSNGSTTTFTVTNAKSITSVERTGTSGLVDTYTVSFNDGTSTTFTVTNGASIQSIEKTSTTGLVDVYTVTLTNGDTETFTVTNAKSITSVSMVSGTHAPGTTDTYRISFNDGDTMDFTVYNGTNGTGSVSTVDGIQAVNQNVPLLLTGNGAPTTSTVGQLYQRYFDLNSHILYICTAIDDSGAETTYTWAGTGVPVDSALSTMSENPVQNKVITNRFGTLETSVNGKLNLAGGTMSGNIVMANKKITGLGTPTANGDAVNKSYADGLLSGYRTATAQDAIDAGLAKANEVGIVITGKRPSIAVTSGQYVIVRNSTISGIADGLYTANTALSPSTDATAANLTAVSSGGLNDLKRVVNYNPELIASGITLAGRSLMSVFGEFFVFRAVFTVNTAQTQNAELFQLPNYNYDTTTTTNVLVNRVDGGNAYTTVGIANKKIVVQFPNGMSTGRWEIFMFGKCI